MSGVERKKKLFANFVMIKKSAVRNQMLSIIFVADAGKNTGVIRNKS